MQFHAGLPENRRSVALRLISQATGMGSRLGEQVPHMLHGRRVYSAVQLRCDENSSASKERTAQPAFTAFTEGLLMDW